MYVSYIWLDSANHMIKHVPAASLITDQVFCSFITLSMNGIPWNTRS